MKYECTIIIYKENKHINVAYNVKKNLCKSVFSIKLDTETGNFKNHVQTNSYHYVVANNKYMG